MRLLKVFFRLVREQAREVWMAMLSLSFGPLIVVIYAALTGGASTVYGIDVENRDSGPWGSALVKTISGLSYADGTRMVDIRLVANAEGSMGKLKDRNLDAILYIPQEFSGAMEAYKAGAGEPVATLRVLRDFGNFRSTLPAILAATSLDELSREASGIASPIRFEDSALGASGNRTEFESYIPGLFIFSIILLIFQTSMIASREVEKLTLRRLAMSRMSVWDFFGGITLFECLMGFLSVSCTLVVAILCGFTSQGSILLMYAVAIVASLSIIGLGLVLASFARTSLQAFIIANLPLGILMFFSGSMFPMPKTVIASIGDIQIGIFDFLPTSHAVNALNKVFSMGAGIGDIAYELVAMSVLSIAFFAIGLGLFNKMRLKRPI